MRAIGYRKPSPSLDALEAFDIPRPTPQGRNSVASRSTFPLFQAQPSPEPFVKCAQHRRGLTEAEVAAPSNQIDRQLLDDVLKAASACAPRQLAD